MVKIVLPEERKFELLGSIRSWDLATTLRSANMIFIGLKGQIAEY